jgi:hypothetical protein
VLDIHRGSLLGWPGKLLFMVAAALMPLFDEGACALALFMFITRRRGPCSEAANVTRQPLLNCARPLANCPCWISSATLRHSEDRRPKSFHFDIRRLRRTYADRSRTTFTRQVRAFQRSLFDNDHNSHGQGGPTMFARIGVMRALSAPVRVRRDRPELP